MAGRIPAMRGADVVAALTKYDFEVARIEGSHHIMQHPDGRGTTVPVHNRDVAKGTMGSIMQDTGLTAEQLRNPKLARREARELTPQEVTEGSPTRAERREVWRESRPVRRARTGETAAAGEGRARPPQVVRGTADVK